MDGVGDEIAPGPRDALEAAEGPEGDAVEDLQKRIIGEPGHHRGVVVHAAGKGSGAAISCESEVPDLLGDAHGKDRDLGGQ